MLKNLLGSPLTKYMGIAILVLGAALSGAVYLSYQFYGEKEVAQAESEQLSVAVEDEKEQTEKALESNEIINEAVENVRRGEKEIDRASQELQDQVSKPTPINPTGDNKNETQSTTEPCDSYLSDDDVRMLRKAHCLTDGDTSDCD